MGCSKADCSIAAARTTARPFVWADITASDDENEVDAPLPEAPTVDDSYREAPLASLENSCDALNRGVADLAGPKAFKFPFQAPTQEGAESTASRGAADAAQPKTLASSSQALSLSGTLSRPSPSTPSPRSTWQPNPNAPDFIPILSTEYRVVCVCISGDAGTPDKGAEPLQGFGGDRGRRGSAAGRKRQPPALKVPALKRTKSEERRPPSSALPGQSQMPPASEEEWQHRITMRKKAVSVGKETPEYKWLAESRQQNEEELVEPQTPDPTDRTVSKRHWKYAVQVWRSALRHRYVEECGGSVASTEEWQSISVATTEEPWGTATIDGDSDSTA
mmetsp:Transcript_80636/g.228425  ORF Transcript_80636/g.228425 Transcript_80636/m.228425 type:complete len:334 (+) Transcript_80636:50-1051(+)